MLHTEAINVIIVDLDRTLLRSDKTISDYTISVLQACKQRGMKLMVATARPLRDTMQFCENIPLDAVAVSNGAKVICGNHLAEYGIDRDLAERLLTALQTDSDLRITLETGVCAYSNKPIAEYETILSDDLAGLARSVSTVKILVHLDREETLEQVQKLIPEALYTSVSHGYLMQIMNRSATKWNGIRTMLEFMDVSPAQAIYFGDDHDDVESLQKCGIGVTVANAIEAAKAAADYIAESNDTDGVAKFLAQMLGMQVKS